MKKEKQIQEWIKGNSIHNKAFDECCPDFSCCRPHLLVPEDVRKVYWNAYRRDDEGTIIKLLNEFLGRFLDGEFGDTDKSVYIAGKGLRGAETRRRK